MATKGRRSSDFLSILSFWQKQGCWMGNALQCREKWTLSNFNMRISDITSPHVTMNGTQVQQVTSNKHLGVNFNNTLSWHQHVDKVYTSCARGVGMIRRLRRKLHPVVLKRIYLGAALPKLEYACPVWCGGPTQKLIKMHANFCQRNGTALPSLQKKVRLSHFSHVLQNSHKTSTIISNFSPSSSLFNNRTHFKKTFRPFPHCIKNLNSQQFLTWSSCFVACLTNKCSTSKLTLCF